MSADADTASVVRLERRGDIALILVDNPPVNALSHAVRSALVDALGEVGEASRVVLACAGRTFFAGADISEFGKAPKAPSLAAVIAAIEACPVPVIAAMHGTALGGGLEVALACDGRIMAGEARAGFPEINLGLIPGAGGTQRAPRLMGVANALDLILEGKPIDALRACELGLVDRVTRGDLVEAACVFASELKKKRCVARLAPPSPPDAETLDAWRTTAARKRRGQTAPLAAIDAVDSATRRPFEAGLKRERALFEDLVAGSQARAMRHLFFAERRAPRVDGLTAAPRRVGKVGVVGAGTMGRGIALACVNAGLTVRVHDADAEALSRAAHAMDQDLAVQVKKGRLAPAEADDRRARLIAADDASELGDCDLVIEAVFESLEVKKAVFETLDAVCRPDAVLASNTSYLDLNAIAASTADPGRVVGLHFFSPAHIMKLLEVVRGARTSDAALATALDLAKRLKKVAVVAGVCRGFIGNRMLQGYQREAGLCLMEGASPAQIDAAMTAFGMPMGPFAMGDMAGLDIGYANRAALTPGEDFEPAAFAVHDRLVDAGRKGVKTGAGFYRYAEGSRTPEQDPELAPVIEAAARANGVKRREVSDAEIVERCVLALVNEGATLLGEGVAQRGSDIDVVYANGYGFPRWRGGPMFYADEAGLSTVLDTLQANARRFGAQWWRPAPLIEALAAGTGRLSTHEAGSDAGLAPTRPVADVNG